MNANLIFVSTVINDLLDELARRREAISAVTERFHADRDPLERDRIRILLELAEQFHGIKIGGTVMRQGQMYKVTRIDVDFCWGDGNAERMKRDKPWTEGRALKKDGTWGERVVRLYAEWEAC